MITKHRDDMVPCQRCEERYREDDPMCPHCGYPLPDTRSAEAQAGQKPVINFNPPPVPPQFAGMQIPLAPAQVVPPASRPAARPSPNAIRPALGRDRFAALAVATAVMGAVAVWWFARSQ
jgi:ribosomal protein L37E